MPKLLGEMEFAGRQVVQPITGKEGKLVRPCEDYFTALGVTSEEWFALEEQERKELIRKRDHYQCIMTGDSLDHVHEFGTRGAHSVRALVPWNMAGFSAKTHNLFHNGMYSIYRFDPLDDKNGLVIIGSSGAPLSRDSLWFYHRGDIEDQEKDVLGARKALWRVAERFRQCKDGKVPKGFIDVYDWGAHLGYSSSQVKEFIRVARFAEETGLIEMLEVMDISTADKFRKIPEEDLKKVLKWFSNLAPAEAWDRFNERYPSGSRGSTFLIFPKSECRKAIARSAGDVEYNPQSEMLIRGCIIAGGNKEV